MANLELRPLNEEEFTAWSEYSMRNFAAENVKNGASVEEATAKAERSRKKNFPEGWKSPGQYVYSLLDPASDTAIGHLWWGPSPDHKTGKLGLRRLGSVGITDPSP